MRQTKHQVDRIKTDEWIDLFQKAITSYDIETFHALLLELPPLTTDEERREVLLLTMDGEAMLCEVRQKLTEYRAAIISQLP